MKKRIKKVIFILMLLLLILYGYYFLTLNYGINIPCLFNKVTGYYCPGCGITRCLFSIMSGHFYKAFNYNRLVFILLPFIFLYLIYNIYLYVFNKEDKIIKKIPNIIWLVLIIIVLLFGVIRNIDSFSYLAP